MSGYSTMNIFGDRILFSTLFKCWILCIFLNQNWVTFLEKKIRKWQILLNYRLKWPKTIFYEFSSKMFIAVNFLLLGNSIKFSQLMLGRGSLFWFMFQKFQSLLSFLTHRNGMMAATGCRKALMVIRKQRQKQRTRPRVTLTLPTHILQLFSLNQTFPTIGHLCGSDGSITC